MNATPTKRRALGSLDLNVTRSPRSPSSTKLAANKGLVGLGGSPLKKKRTTSSTPSPSRKGTTPTKRPLLSVLSEDKENEDVLFLPAAKKLCSDANVLGDFNIGRAKMTVEDVDEVCYHNFRIYSRALLKSGGVNAKNLYTDYSTRNRTSQYRHHRPRPAGRYPRTRAPSSTRPRPLTLRNSPISRNRIPRSLLLSLPPRMTLLLLLLFLLLKRCLLRLHPLLY